MIVVPQQRYRPPRGEWYEVEVTEQKEQENRASANEEQWVGDVDYMAMESLETWTFSTEGKFGVNLQEALDGSAEVTSRFVEASEDDGGVGMALHIVVSKTSILFLYRGVRVLMQSDGSLCTSGPGVFRVICPCRATLRATGSSTSP